MTNITAVCTRTLLVTALFAGSASAADEEAVKKDLASVIALHALPCGEVVAFKEQAARDFNASCRDGNKYRVYINAAGRVVVEKQK